MPAGKVVFSKSSSRTSVAAASWVGSTVTGRSRPASISCLCHNSALPLRAGLWNRPLSSASSPAA